MTGPRLDRVPRGRRYGEWGPRIGWSVLGVTLSVIVAIAVVQGRKTTWFGLAALSAAFMLSCVHRLVRWRVLLLAVIVSPLLVGSSLPIPLGLTLSEALLLFVTLAEAMAVSLTGSAGSFAATLTKSYYVPFVVFAGVGLVSTYRNGDLFAFWPAVCLVPLLLLYATDRLALDADDALWVIRAAVAAVLIYAAIAWIAGATSNAGAWRLGSTGPISLGPLSLTQFSIWVGSVTAMGLPAALVLTLRARRGAMRGLYLAVSIALLATLTLSFSRGASAGAVAGVSVALLVSRRVKALTIVLALFILALAAVILGPTLLAMLPGQGVAHFAQLRHGVGSVDTFALRWRTMGITLRGILEHPLGPGFSYLWNRYGLDEAIVYSMLLNGTGILGFCAFIAMLIQVGRGYVSGLSRTAGRTDTDLAAIGFGTLVAALVSGAADSSIFTEPVQTTVFWSLTIAALVGCVRSRESGIDRHAGSGGAADDPL